MEFRTKGRGKERTVFPVKEGKTYKQDFNEHHLRNPSWVAKHTVKGDIKDMYRRDNPESPTDHNKDQQLYKKRLQNTADGEIVKQNKRQTKKQEKLLKKQERETEKLAKQDYVQDRADEENEREEIKDIGG